MGTYMTGRWLATLPRALTRGAALCALLAGCATAPPQGQGILLSIEGGSAVSDVEVRMLGTHAPQPAVFRLRGRQAPGTRVLWNEVHASQGQLEVAWTHRGQRIAQSLDARASPAAARPLRNFRLVIDADRVVGWRDEWVQPPADAATAAWGTRSVLMDVRGTVTAQPSARPEAAPASVATGPDRGG